MAKMKQGKNKVIKKNMKPKPKIVEFKMGNSVTNRIMTVLCV